MASKSSHRPRRLVGVSTKMYFGVEQTKAYVRDLLTHLPTTSTLFDDVDIFLIPDFVSLSPVADLLRNSRLILGGQNCFHEDNGPYTGEVSPAQLREVGCKIVELGHAERRRIFGETDYDAAKKAAAACRNDLIPLVCIGEKTRGEISVAIAECRPQVLSLLDAVPEGSEVIFAYEPVWAIGQPNPANAEHVVGVTKAIHEMCRGRKGLTRVLYGGSAGPGLYTKLAEGCDGLFLGRFAHKPEAFVQTIEEICNAP
ncbi:MAG: hypothetical protein M1828_002107 [Chrysothrix sp. TS-e1954]|nr:MAG: hypothetical protein M1828_002107 [Chrysothrix sp. TS-e1954]